MKQVRIFAALLTWFLLIPLKPVFAGKIKMDAASRADDQVELQFTASKLSATEIPTGQLLDAIEIRLPKEDTNPILRAHDLAKPAKKGKEKDPDEGREKGFVWKSLSDPKKVESDGGITLSFRLLVEPSTGRQAGDWKALEEEDGSVLVSVSFTPKSGRTLEISKFAVKPFYGKPIEAPEDFTVRPTHEGLSVGWAANKSVKYTEKNYSAVPSKVVLFLFEGGESALHLDAKEVDPTHGQHGKSSCSYQYKPGDKPYPCITCEGEGAIFLNTKQELSNEALEVFTVDNASDRGAVDLGGLAPGKEYVIAAQYLDGTKRTLCQNVVPIRTLSLTELSGEAPAEMKDKRCFIATAAYGSSLAQEVELFRWFRGAYLLQSSLGKSFVAFYYRNSPPLADLIAERPWARALVRGMLYVPLRIIAAVKAFSASAESATQPVAQP